jgi:hypothetical protein
VGSTFFPLLKKAIYVKMTHCTKRPVWKVDRWRVANQVDLFVHGEGEDDGDDDSNTVIPPVVNALNSWYKDKL